MKGQTMKEEEFLKEELTATAFYRKANNGTDKVTDITFLIDGYVITVDTEHKGCATWKPLEDCLHDPADIPEI